MRLLLDRRDRTRYRGSMQENRPEDSFARMRHYLRSHWRRAAGRHARWGFAGWAALLLSIAATSGVRAETRVLTPTEDTYVVDWGDNPSPLHEIRALEHALYVSKSDVDPQRYLAFLRFDLASITPEQRWEVAWLRLRTTVSCDPNDLEGSAGYGVHTVTQPWSADELDGRVIPALGDALDVQRPQEWPLGSWVAWNVTAALSVHHQVVQQNGLGVAVSDPWSRHSSCAFHSAEGANPPELVLFSRERVWLPLLGNGFRLPEAGISRRTALTSVASSCPWTRSPAP
jgi:hypothetical protein